MLFKNTSSKSGFIQWNQAKPKPHGGCSTGFTLVEILIGIALMALIFWGLTGVFRTSLVLVTSGKAKSGAFALATSQMEYIKSLSYTAVGTQGGIPAGEIPQVSTTTLNNITYTINTFIQYVDSEADGLDENDENDITADFKRVRVEVEWLDRGVNESTVLVSDVVPPGIENLSGGGTLKVNVLDSQAQPLEGATVRITNNTVSPNIDLIYTSNSSGSASFPGAPAGAGYQVVVSKSGYSTAQTYDASSDNPNPNPGHITVEDDKLSSATFQIDILGHLKLFAARTIYSDEWSTSFVDSYDLSEQNQVAIVGDSLQLDVTASSTYYTSGNAYSIEIAPEYLNSWGKLQATSSMPVGTNVVMRMYSMSGGVRTIVPDTDLPGNSTGFSTYADLSSLATSTYSSLVVQFELTTGNPYVTPMLEEISLTYDVGPTPLSDASVTWTGSKTIGTDSSGNSLIKNTYTSITDAAGSSVDEAEWDTYTYSITSPAGYRLFSACPVSPIVLDPASTTTVSALFIPTTGNTLHVQVVDDAGLPIAGVDVNVGPSGSVITISTDGCGQAFFENLSGVLQPVTISEPGYENINETVTPNGETRARYVLTVPQT